MNQLFGNIVDVGAVGGSGFQSVVPPVSVRRMGVTSGRRRVGNASGRDQAGTFACGERPTDDRLRVVRGVVHSVAVVAFHVGRHSHSADVGFHSGHVRCRRTRRVRHLAVHAVRLSTQASLTQ